MADARGDADAAAEDVVELQGEGAVTADVGGVHGGAGKLATTADVAGSASSMQKVTASSGAVHPVPPLRRLLWRSSTAVGCGKPHFLPSYSDNAQTMCFLRHASRISGLRCARGPRSRPPLALLLMGSRAGGSPSPAALHHGRLRALLTPTDLASCCLLLLNPASASMTSAPALPAPPRARIRAPPASDPLRPCSRSTTLVLLRPGVPLPLLRPGSPREPPTASGWPPARAPLAAASPAGSASGHGQVLHARGRLPCASLPAAPPAPPVAVSRAAWPHPIAGSPAACTASAAGRRVSPAYASAPGRPRGPAPPARRLAPPAPPL
nr:translation initiation factor IF-2-like [Aegilops tauschii subsp. strangulata]